MEQLASHFDVHLLYEQEDAAAFIAAQGEAIRGFAGGAHVPIDEAYMAQFPNLEIIANFGVGYDTIDAKAAASLGIMVTNTPDVLNDEVADTAIGLMIATVRELPQAERYLRAGKWIGGNYPLTRGTLAGKILGIAGFGRIGKAIAKRAEAFGLTVHYHGRSPQDRPEPYHATLSELAKSSDILMSVLPGGTSTDKAINEEVLSALGADGYFINIGRGSSVDEPALIAALERRVIAGAGLDVFADEPHVPERLLACENAVLLPHVGSGSVATRDAMGQLVVDNLTGWFRNGKPVTPVPETPSSSV